jgi:effector-binding domain-containing protein
MGSAPGPEIVELDEQQVAVIAGQVAMAELPEFFDSSFGELAATLAAQGVGIVGPAFARYHGPPDDVADLEVGFPTDRAVSPTGSVTPSVLPAGRAARAVHEGSYDRLGESWERLGSWLAQQGQRPAESMWPESMWPKSMWEVYVTEPSPDMDPADLRTELWWPLDAT